VDWEVCLGSQHSSSCKPAPRRGFGWGRVCGASAQRELRTGSARRTCETVGSGAVGHGRGHLWVKGMEAEEFVSERVLAAGWEYLWSWSPVGTPCGGPLPDQLPVTPSPVLPPSLEKMKHPGKDPAPLKQLG